MDGTEIGMVQRGCGTRFAEEPFLRRGIQTEVWEQELQRDGTPEAGVFRMVHHAHAPGAEWLENPKVRDGASGQAQEIGCGCAERQEGGFERCEAVIHFSVGTKQRLHCRGQFRISRPDGLEAAGSRSRVELDQRVEGGLNLLPAARIHHTPQCNGSPLSSSASHARAERNSRFAVASETPRAAAVSSSVNPPK